MSKWRNIIGKKIRSKSLMKMLKKRSRKIILAKIWRIPRKVQVMSMVLSKIGKKTIIKLHQRHWCKVWCEKLTGISYLRITLTRRFKSIKRLIFHLRLRTIQNNHKTMKVKRWNNVSRLWKKDKKSKGNDHCDIFSFYNESPTCFKRMSFIG